MSTTLLGRKEDGRANVTIETVDAFAEAPFYAGGEDSTKKTEDGSPLIRGLKVGTEICGYFRGLRTSKSKNSSGSHSRYICLELGTGDDVERIRLMAPTQLANVLTENDPEMGAYIELTYEGMREASGEGKDYHVYKVSMEKIQH